MWDSIPGQWAAVSWVRATAVGSTPQREGEGETGESKWHVTGFTLAEIFPLDECVNEYTLFSSVWKQQMKKTKQTQEEMLYGTAKQAPPKRRLAETPTPGKIRKVGVDPQVATTVPSMYLTCFPLLSSTPLQHSLLQLASLTQALGEPPTSPLSRNHLCLPARCVQGLSDPFIPFINRLYSLNVCCFVW